jgi:hypothetical protein
MFSFLEFSIEFFKLLSQNLFFNPHLKPQDIQSSKGWIAGDLSSQDFSNLDGCQEFEFMKILEYVSLFRFCETREFLFYN